MGHSLQEMESTVLWVPSNSGCSVNSLKPEQWPRWLGARLLYSVLTPRWILAQSRQSTTGGSTPSKLSPCDPNLIKPLLSTVLILVQNFNWSCPQLGLHVGVCTTVVLSTGQCLALHGGYRIEREIQGWGRACRDVGLTPGSSCCHPSCHPARALPHPHPTLGCQLHSLTSCKTMNQFLRSPSVFLPLGMDGQGGLAGVCCWREHLHPTVAAPVAYWGFINLGVFRSCSKY